MTSSKLPTFSEPLTFVIDSRLAHGAPKGPEGGTDGPSHSCGFETPFSSPSALKGEGRKLLHAGGLRGGGRIRVTSNLAPGAGFPALPSLEATQGRPCCPRMEVLEPPGESLECLLVDTKGMSALALDNYGVSSPAPVMNGSQFGAVWGPVLTHLYQLWQKSHALRKPQFLHPQNGDNNDNTTSQDHGTAMTLPSTQSLFFQVLRDRATQ